MRTVASGTCKAAATSSTLDSSTARRMNTVRKASGSRSMRASTRRRTSARIAAPSGRPSGSSSSNGSICGSAVPTAPSRGITCAPRRRSRPSASLMTMRTSQVDSFDSARNVGSARQARRYASCSASSASASTLQDGTRRAEQQPVVAPHDRFECGVVAGNGARDEFGVGRRRRRGKPCRCWCGRLDCFHGVLPLIGWNIVTPRSRCSLLERAP